MKLHITKFISTLLVLCCSLSISFSQATWMPISEEDYNWHNPANWSWSGGGSGLPTSTTDITFPSDMEYPPIVLPGMTAECKNISGEYFSVTLLVDAKIQVYGNISPSFFGYISALDFSEEYSTEANVEFLGNGDQTVTNTQIETGNIIVNKPNGDVILNEMAIIIALNSVKLQNAAVAIGNAPKGNIILNGGNLALDFSASFEIAETTSAAPIPPHIVANLPFEYLETGVNNLFCYIDFTSEDGDGKLDGTAFHPVGSTVYSYTPIVITQTGADGSLWAVHVTNETPENCDLIPYDVTTAAQLNWHIRPFHFEDEVDYITFDDVISNPANIVIQFNAANIGYDVNESFEASDLVLYYKTSTECSFTDDISTVIDGDIISITKEAQTKFSLFNVASEPDEINVVSIDVTTMGGVPAIINVAGGTLQMQSTILPAMVDQTVTWSIVPVTGAATISGDGLVTAVADGTVYAKAVSVADPSFSDSMLITISNQTSSVNDIEMQIGLQIYPNPVSDILNIKIEKNHPEINVMIIDILGKVAWKSTYTANELNVTQSIPTSTLPSGIYIIQLEGDGIQYSKKFIKE